MSLSILDDLRPGDRSIVAAAGASVENDPYAPDLEAYRVDPKNDKAQKLRSAVEGGHVKSLTVSAPAYDGVRERVRLNGREAKTYLSASMPKRARLVAAKVREARWSVATKAARQLAEGKVKVERLHPYAEACLREFDLLEDAETRVPLDDGGYDLRKTVALREGVAAMIREAKAPLKEDGGYYDAGGSVTDLSTPGYLDREYQNYSGPLGQQLQLNDIWDQLAKTWWAVKHDPVAAECVNIIRNFVIGRGVTVTANDKRVQGVIDGFDKLNKMPNRVKLWTIGLSRDGELFVRKIKPGDGTMLVRSLSPDTIWDIVTDAEDIERVFWYVQRYMTRTQLFEPPDGDGQHWVDRWLKPEEVIHSKVNAAESEVRGRSDLFPVLGHLKRLRDLFDTVVLKEQAQAAYQWDFTVDGSPADVTTFAATSVPKGKPQPGSFYVHNKAVEVSAMAPQKSASTSNGSSWEGLLTMIAIGVGIAKDYLGVTSRGSRATALVATEPTAIRIEERQDVLGSVLRNVYEDAIEEARLYGLLDGVTDFGFKTMFPTIEKSDSPAIVDLINQGVSMGYVSHERAANRFASELDIDDYDYDEEQAKILVERAAGKRAPLIMAKYANLPQGDAVSGVAGAEPGDPATATSQGASAQSPLGKSGAAQIRKDLGPQAETLHKRVSITESWIGAYA